MFLELPNVLKEILEYMKSELLRPPGIYTSVYNGEYWRKLVKECPGKTFIGIYLYYDDFGISDPLSTAAKIYKIGGLYFTFVGLPAKFISMTENVFLGQFILSLI